MSQSIYKQPDSKAIEALKAARNQVIPKPQSGRDPGAECLGVQADKGRNEDKNVNPVRDKTPEASVQPSAGRSLTGFTEEFVQKLTSVEKETAEIDEEIAKVEKLWSDLVEKKKQLEARRDELIKVKDKLKELDKEMSDVLKSQSFDKLMIDPEQRRMGQ